MEELHPKCEYDFQQYSERGLSRMPCGCHLGIPSEETLQREGWLRRSHLEPLQLKDPSLEGPTLYQFFPEGPSTVDAEVEALLGPDHSTLK